MKSELRLHVMNPCNGDALMTPKYDPCNGDSFRQIINLSGSHLINYFYQTIEYFEFY